MKTVSRILLGSVLALAGAAAPAADRACKNPQFYIGAGTHMGQNKLDYGRAQWFFKYAQVNSFRDEFYWQRLEKDKPGELKIPDNLADLDRTVRNHKSSGGPLPLIALNYGNKFYDKGDLPRSPEAVQAYGRYAEFVARHYSASAPIFEIWNEWNAGFGSNVTPRQKGSAEDYMQLVQTAVPLIRKASPQSLILVGATAGLDMKWSLKLAEMGGLKSVDGFSIHPYNYRHHSSRSPEDAVEGLKVLHDGLTQATGQATVPIYITETGVPSSKGKNGYPEDAVAVYAMRFLLLVRAQPYICGVWWYELFDSGDRDDEDEHRFGLFRRDGGAKPAAKAIAQVAAFLKEGTNFAQKRTGNIQSVSWRMPDGSEHVAYWAIKGKDSISFDKGKHAQVDVPFGNEAAEATIRAAAQQAAKDGELEVDAKPQIFKRLNKP